MLVDKLNIMKCDFVKGHIVFYAMMDLKNIIEIQQTADALFLVYQC